MVTLLVPLFSARIPLLNCCAFRLLGILLKCIHQQWVVAAALYVDQIHLLSSVMSARGASAHYVGIYYHSGSFGVSLTRFLAKIVGRTLLVLSGSSRKNESYRASTVLLDLSTISSNIADSVICNQ